MIAAYIQEMKDVCEEVRASNNPQINAAADALSAALDDAEASTNFLLDNLKAGAKQVVLAGATPYLRLLGLTAGTVYLAKSALTSDEVHLSDRAALMNFMAANLLGETASLRATVENGAETLRHAGSLLAAAAANA